MADPAILKTVRIKTGVVRRLAKERYCYEKEADQQRARIEKLKKDNGHEAEYNIRKQEEVLNESLMMIPDCLRRLTVAFDDLNTFLTNNLSAELKDAKEYADAVAVLQDVNCQLQNPVELHF